MKQVSDLAFPNIKFLRRECLDRLYAAPREQVTDLEWAGIEELMVQHIQKTAQSSGKTCRSDWYTDPALCSIGEDLKESDPPVPKWAAFTSWLGYDGIVKYHPMLVTRIVQEALEGTLERVR